jgi:hypothetical protein
VCSLSMSLSSYPLSNLLPDAEHSKIWLNELTAEELRDARKV